ncbi:MAG: hypothetical protein BMS9Abin29_1944 [Gemmatimonadota bacterium]|nr:MAG: hypothetical protein BMS9Abin29_1944 [Gemmatimonadota bacterium]
MVPAEGGTPRQLTDGDWNHNGVAWSPDGTEIYFTLNRAEDWARPANWQESEIYAVTVATGDIRQLTNRRGPDGGPVPSPDGKLIAYTAGDEHDDTYRNQQIFVMNRDGSGSRMISGEYDGQSRGMRWAPDGSGLYFSVTRLTEVNADVLHGVTLGEVEEIWYDSDQFRIQGWIVKPPEFDASRKYPLMLSIHGGPHGMYNGGFNFAFQEHAANDYVILYTNPRGSTGYGTEFANAINHDYPGADMPDLMRGVDEMLSRGYIDEDNLFVYGCSGGGILTTYIVGNTDRFAAASAHYPIVNWMSAMGTSDAISYARTFETPFWEDATEWIDRSSIFYVENVKTPTMLMTGEKDLRTPMGQTEEFYQALQYLGVPTVMIRYQNERHGTGSNPSNFMRTQLYSRKWFEKWGTHKAERSIS